MTFCLSWLADSLSWASAHKAITLWFVNINAIVAYMSEITGYQTCSSCSRRVLWFGDIICLVTSPCIFCQTKAKTHFHCHRLASVFRFEFHLSCIPRTMGSVSYSELTMCHVLLVGSVSEIISCHCERTLRTPDTTISRHFSFCWTWRRRSNIHSLQISGPNSNPRWGNEYAPTKPKFGPSKSESRDYRIALTLCVRDEVSICQTNKTQAIRREETSRHCFHYQCIISWI